MESDDSAVNPFLMQYPEDILSFLAEQNNIDKEVKLSSLLQLDDTFSTEDRWPI